MSKKIFLLYFAILLLSCNTTFVRNKEAIDDKLTFDKALILRSKINNKVKALIETQPVSASSTDQDAADDPAIWYNNTFPEKSIVFGSNKTAGIHSYDLEGNEIQFIKCGKINNVDIRQGISVGSNKYVDVLAGSNRSDNSVSLFVIRENGTVDPSKEYKIYLGKIEPYGFCLQKTKSDKLIAYVNDKNGFIYQIGIDIKSDSLDWKILREIKVKTQPEGMVVDDEEQIIYIGEEQKGIHYLSTDANSGFKPLLLTGSSDSNPMIHYDIEGLAIFHKGQKKYLLASVQGNFSYAIFDLQTKDYVKSFVIEQGNFDPVEETDGLEVLQKPLNSVFPEGIFIVQDGFNYDKNHKMAQNFKYISLKDISKFID
jgi:3-phytase